mgnify:CR=1 FL=1
MSEITVHFFARLREELGVAQISFPISGALIVSDLIGQIVAAHTDWQAALNDPDVLIAVNQTMVGHDHRIQPGDEVAFLPPVTGG